MGRGVRDGLAGKFEAAAVGEDEGEGLGKGCVGGWCGGDVDFEEGGGGSAAIGVEGGEGEAAGGAEGGTGESAGVVVGKEGLNLGGSAAGFSERHSYTKTESGRFGNHGAGLALTMDHGTQYLADHFLKQVRFWGIQPSFAFVSEPPTKDYA